MMIGLWCNGSTTGFGSVCPGSNPGSPTKKESEFLLALFLLYYSQSKLEGLVKCKKGANVLEKT